MKLKLLDLSMVFGLAHDGISVTLELFWPYSSSGLGLVRDRGHVMRPHPPRAY